MQRNQQSNGGRRDGELEEDYSERRRIEALVRLPAARKRERLAALEAQDGARDGGGGGAVDRTRTGLEAGVDGFAQVAVLAAAGNRPDLLAMAAEEEALARRAGVAQRELPVDRAEVLAEFLGWVFERGYWQEAGDVMARIYALVVCAFPDLVGRYDDRALRVLVAPGGAKARRLRRKFFSQAEVRAAGWEFRLERRRERPCDLAAVCRLGLGGCLAHLDVVRLLLEMWFHDDRAGHHAAPASVVRRALATGFATRPDLVRGMTMEELAEATGQVKQTFQWMVDRLFKANGLVPATCREEGDYAGGQQRARQRRERGAGA